MTWLNKSFINSDDCFCWFPQWKEAKPEELMDSKLRCVFEMPVENEKMVRLLLTVSAFHIFVHLRPRYLCKYWRQCRSAVPPASILHALKNAQIPERKIIFLLQWQPPLSLQNLLGSWWQLFYILATRCRQIRWLRVTWKSLFNWDTDCAFVIPHEADDFISEPREIP